MSNSNNTDDLLLALEENLLTSDEIAKNALTKVEEIKAKIDQTDENDKNTLATLKHELLTTYHTYITQVRDVAAQRTQLAEEAV